MALKRERCWSQPLTLGLVSSWEAQLSAGSSPTSKQGSNPRVLILNRLWKDELLKTDSSLDFDRCLCELLPRGAHCCGSGLELPGSLTPPVSQRECDVLSQPTDDKLTQTGCFGAPALTDAHLHLKSWNHSLLKATDSWGFLLKAAQGHLLGSPGSFSVPP